MEIFQKPCPLGWEHSGLGNERWLHAAKCFLIPKPRANSQKGLNEGIETTSLTSKSRFQLMLAMSFLFAS